MYNQHGFKNRHGKRTEKWTEYQFSDRIRVRPSCHK